MAFRQDHSGRCSGNSYNDLCKSFRQVKLQNASKNSLFADYFFIRNQLLFLQNDEMDLSVPSKLGDIIQLLRRFIQEVPRHTRHSKEHIEDVYRLLICLHDYISRYIKVYKKFPLTQDLLFLLVNYVELEYEVLYYPKNYSPKYQEEVENRILTFLLTILYDPSASKRKCVTEPHPVDNCAINALYVIKSVKWEYKRNHNLIENLMSKLLRKLNVLDKMNEIREQADAFNLQNLLRVPKLQQISIYLQKCNFLKDEAAISEDELDIIQYPIKGAGAVVKKVCYGERDIGRNDLNDYIHFSQDSVIIPDEINVQSRRNNSSRRNFDLNSTTSQNERVVCISDDDSDVEFVPDEVSTAVIVLDDYDTAISAVSNDSVKQEFESKDNSSSINVSTVCNEETVEALSSVADKCLELSNVNLPNTEIIDEYEEEVAEQVPGSLIRKNIVQSPENNTTTAVQEEQLVTNSEIISAVHESEENLLECEILPVAAEVNMNLSTETHSISQEDHHNLTDIFLIEKRRVMAEGSADIGILHESLDNRTVTQSDCRSSEVDVRDELNKNIKISDNNLESIHDINTLESINVVKKLLNEPEKTQVLDLTFEENTVCAKTQNSSYDVYYDNENDRSSQSSSFVVEKGSTFTDNCLSTAVEGSITFEGNQINESQLLSRTYHIEDTLKNNEITKNIIEQLDRAIEGHEGNSSTLYVEQDATDIDYNIGINAIAIPTNKNLTNTNESEDYVLECPTADEHSKNLNCGVEEQESCAHKDISNEANDALEECEYSVCEDADLQKEHFDISFSKETDIGYNQQVANVISTTESHMENADLKQHETPTIEEEVVCDSQLCEKSKYVHDVQVTFDTQQIVESSEVSSQCKNVLMEISGDDELLKIDENDELLKENEKYQVLDNNEKDQLREKDENDQLLQKDENVADGEALEDCVYSDFLLNNEKTSDVPKVLDQLECVSNSAKLVSAEPEIITEVQDSYSKIICKSHVQSTDFKTLHNNIETTFVEERILDGNHTSVHCAAELGDEEKLLDNVELRSDYHETLGINRTESLSNSEEKRQTLDDSDCFKKSVYELEQTTQYEPIEEVIEQSVSVNNDISKSESVSNNSEALLENRQTLDDSDCSKKSVYELEQTTQYEPTEEVIEQSVSVNNNTSKSESVSYNFEGTLESIKTLDDSDCSKKSVYELEQTTQYEPPEEVIEQSVSVNNDTSKSESVSYNFEGTLENRQTLDDSDCSKKSVYELEYSQYEPTEEVIEQSVSVNNDISKFESVSNNSEATFENRQTLDDSECSKKSVYELEQTTLYEPPEEVMEQSVSVNNDISKSESVSNNSEATLENRPTLDDSNCSKKSVYELEHTTQYEPTKEVLEQFPSVNENISQHLDESFCSGEEIPMKSNHFNDEEIVRDCDERSFDSSHHTPSNLNCIEENEQSSEAKDEVRFQDHLSTSLDDIALSHHVEIETTTYAEFSCEEGENCCEEVHDEKNGELPSINEESITYKECEQTEIVNEPYNENEVISTAETRGHEIQAEFGTTVSEDYHSNVEVSYFEDANKTTNCSENSVQNVSEHDIVIQYTSDLPLDYVHEETVVTESCEVMTSHNCSNDLDVLASVAATKEKIESVNVKNTKSKRRRKQKNEKQKSKKEELPRRITRNSALSKLSIEASAINENSKCIPSTFMNLESLITPPPVCVYNMISNPNTDTEESMDERFSCVETLQDILVNNIAFDEDTLDDGIELVTQKKIEQEVLISIPESEKDYPAIDYEILNQAEEFANTNLSLSTSEELCKELRLTMTKNVEININTHTQFLAGIDNVAKISEEVIEEKPLNVEVIKEKSLTVEVIKEKPLNVEVIDEKSLTVEVIEEKPITVEVIEEKPLTVDVHEFAQTTTDTQIPIMPLKKRKNYGRRNVNTISKEILDEPLDLIDTVVPNETAIVEDKDVVLQSLAHESSDRVQNRSDSKRILTKAALKCFQVPCIPYVHLLKLPLHDTEKVSDDTTKKRSKSEDGGRKHSKSKNRSVSEAKDIKQLRSRHGTIDSITDKHNCEASNPIQREVAGKMIKATQRRTSSRLLSTDEGEKAQIKSETGHRPRTRSHYEQSELEQSTKTKMRTRSKSVFDSSDDLKILEIRAKTVNSDHIAPHAAPGLIKDATEVMEPLQNEINDIHINLVEVSVPDENLFKKDELSEENNIEINSINDNCTKDRLEIKSSSSSTERGVTKGTEETNLCSIEESVAVKCKTKMAITETKSEIIQTTGEHIEIEIETTAFEQSTVEHTRPKSEEIRKVTKNKKGEVASKIDRSSTKTNRGKVKEKKSIRANNENDIVKTSINKEVKLKDAQVKKVKQLKTCEDLESKILSKNNEKLKPKSGHRKDKTHVINDSKPSRCKSKLTDQIPQTKHRSTSKLESVSNNISQDKIKGKHSKSEHFPKKSKSKLHIDKKAKNMGSENPKDVDAQDSMGKYEVNRLKLRELNVKINKMENVKAEESVKKDKVVEQKEETKRHKVKKKGESKSKPKDSSSRERSKLRHDKRSQSKQDVTEVSSESNSEILPHISKEGQIDKENVTDSSKYEDTTKIQQKSEIPTQELQLQNDSQCVDDANFEWKSNAIKIAHPTVELNSVEASAKKIKVERGETLVSDMESDLCFNSGEHELTEQGFTEAVQNEDHAGGLGSSLTTTDIIEHFEGISAEIENVAEVTVETSCNELSEDFNVPGGNLSQDVLSDSCSIEVIPNLNSLMEDISEAATDNATEVESLEINSSELPEHVNISNGNLSQHLQSASCSIKVMPNLNSLQEKIPDAEIDDADKVESLETSSSELPENFNVPDGILSQQVQSASYSTKIMPNLNSLQEKEVEIDDTKDSATEMENLIKQKEVSESITEIVEKSDIFNVPIENGPHTEIIQQLDIVQENIVEVESLSPTEIIESLNIAQETAGEVVIEQNTDILNIPQENVSEVIIDSTLNTENTNHANLSQEVHVEKTITAFMNEGEALNTSSEDISTADVQISQDLSKMPTENIAPKEELKISCLKNKIKEKLKNMEQVYQTKSNSSTKLKRCIRTQNLKKNKHRASLPSKRNRPKKVSSNMTKVVSSECSHADSNVAPKFNSCLDLKIQKLEELKCVEKETSHSKAGEANMGKQGDVNSVKEVLDPNATEKLNAEQHIKLELPTKGKSENTNLQNSVATNDVDWVSREVSKKICDELTSAETKAVHDFVTTHEEAIQRQSEANEIQHLRVNKERIDSVTCSLLIQSSEKEDRALEMLQSENVSSLESSDMQLTKSVVDIEAPELKINEGGKDEEGDESDLIKKFNEHVEKEDLQTDVPQAQETADVNEKNLCADFDEGGDDTELIESIVESRKTVSENRLQTEDQQELEDGNEVSSDNQIEEIINETEPELSEKEINIVEYEKDVKYQKVLPQDVSNSCKDSSEVLPQHLSNSKSVENEVSEDVSNIIRDWDDSCDGQLLQGFDSYKSDHFLTDIVNDSDLVISHEESIIDNSNTVHEETCVTEGIEFNQQFDSEIEIKDKGDSVTHNENLNGIAINNSISAAEKEIYIDGEKEGNNKNLSVDDDLILVDAGSLSIKTEDYRASDIDRLFEKYPTKQTKDFKKIPKKEHSPSQKRVRFNLKRNLVKTIEYDNDEIINKKQRLNDHSTTVYDYEQSYKKFLTAGNSAVNENISKLTGENVGLSHVKDSTFEIKRKVEETVGLKKSDPKSIDRIIESLKSKSLKKSSTLMENIEQKQPIANVEVEKMIVEQSPLPVHKQEDIQQAAPRISPPSDEKVNIEPQQEAIFPYLQDTTKPNSLLQIVPSENEIVNPDQLLDVTDKQTTTTCEITDNLIAVMFSEQNRSSKTGFIFFKGSDHNYHSIGDPLLGGECDRNESDHSSENKEMVSPELENVLISDTMLPYLTDNHLNQESSEDSSADFQLLELIGNSLGRESSPPLAQPINCDYQTNLKPDLGYDESSTSNNIEFSKVSNEVFLNHFQQQAMSVENMSELMNVVLTSLQNLNNMTKPVVQQETECKDIFLAPDVDFNVDHVQESQPPSLDLICDFSQPQQPTLESPVSKSSDCSNLHYLPISFENFTTNDMHKKVIVEQIPQIIEETVREMPQLEPMVEKSDIKLSPSDKAKLHMISCSKPKPPPKKQLNNVGFVRNSSKTKPSAPKPKKLNEVKTKRSEDTENDLVTKPTLSPQTATIKHSALNVPLGIPKERSLPMIDDFSLTENTKKVVQKSTESPVSTLQVVKTTEDNVKHSPASKSPRTTPKQVETECANTPIHCDMIDIVKGRKRKPVDYSSIEKLLESDDFDYRKGQKGKNKKDDRVKLKQKEEDVGKVKSKVKTPVHEPSAASTTSQLAVGQTKTTVFEDSDDDVPKKKKTKLDPRLEPDAMNALFDELVKEGNVNNALAKMTPTSKIAQEQPSKPNTIFPLEPNFQKKSETTPVKQIGVVNPIPRQSNNLRKEPVNRSSYSGEDGRASSQYYSYYERNRRSYPYPSRESGRSSHQGSSRRTEYPAHTSDQRYSLARSSSSRSSRSSRHHSNSRSNADQRGYWYGSNSDLAWREDMKKKFPHMFKDEVFF